MSEEKTNEVNWGEVYEYASADLKATVKYCIIGWIFVSVGLINVFLAPLYFVGFLIIALPMAIQWYRGGWKKLFFWKEYEIITTTTYSDGSTSTSSDYGSTSQFMGVIFKVMLFCFVIVLSCICTLLKIFYLIYQCFSANKHLAEKPFTQSSVFRTIVSGLAVLVLLPCIAIGLSYLPIPHNMHYKAPAAIEQVEQPVSEE